VAGRDAVRAASQLDDPSALRLWLRAKHIVLTSFIGPIAAIVAMVIAALQQEYMTGAAIAITLLFLPSRRVERRGMDRTLAALSPPEAALALAASFRLASSVASVGCPAGPPLPSRAVDWDRFAQPDSDHLDHCPSGLSAT
jgi:hypothetical protein